MAFFFGLCAAESLVGFGIMAGFALANGFALAEDHGLLGLLWGCAWALLGLGGLIVYWLYDR